MKKVLITIIILQFIFYYWLACSYQIKLLNMANTVNPIITKLSEDLGEYKNPQIIIGGESPLSGKLIYKREKISGNKDWFGGCVSGYMNTYYIRLYEWDWEGDNLWYKPVKDIPLNCFSGIEESSLLIPYHDKDLQNAKIGEKIYIIKSPS